MSETRETRGNPLCGNCGGPRCKHFGRAEYCTAQFLERCEGDTFHFSGRYEPSRPTSEEVASGPVVQFLRDEIKAIQRLARAGDLAGVQHVAREALTAFAPPAPLGEPPAPEDPSVTEFRRAFFAAVDSRKPVADSRPAPAGETTPEVYAEFNVAALTDFGLAAWCDAQAEGADSARCGSGIYDAMLANRAAGLRECARRLRLASRAPSSEGR